MQGTLATFCNPNLHFLGLPSDFNHFVTPGHVETWAFSFATLTYIIRAFHLTSIILFYRDTFLHNQVQVGQFVQGRKNGRLMSFFLKVEPPCDLT